MIVTTVHGVRIADLYFGERKEDVCADVIRYNCWPVIVPSTISSECSTMLLDLKMDKEALWKGLDKNVRNEINRATRDGCYVERSSMPTAGMIDGFADVFDSFARLKRLHPISRRRLHALAENRALSLSVAKFGTYCLVWHAYLGVARRIRLLHSVSLYRQSNDTAERQSIGRANRLLHWQDLSTFRSEAWETLDMGGWHVGDSRELKSVNAFKKGFGGRTVKEFNCVAPQTFKGRVGYAAIVLLKWRGRAKRRSG
jgi:lipid II:glycine glycyltransferase (peptidoglycan interpeptide bridge formation enzyme)